MVTWASKDPDAVFDYSYTIPLDEGDTVDSSTFEQLSGTAVIDDQDRAGDTWTVWISGGTDGETNVYRIAWATAAGREDDDIITLAIISNQVDVPLVLTGYAKPSPAHLIMRYPAFADVDKAVIQYWLTDAESAVDTSWSERDYAAGLMSLAAHSLSLAGYPVVTATTTTSTPALPAGVTSVKSADFSMTVTPEQANALASGSLSSSRYGLEFKALLRRNKAGPRVMGTGSLDFSNWPYPMGAF